MVQNPEIEKEEDLKYGTKTFDFNITITLVQTTLKSKKLLLGFVPKLFNRSEDQLHQI